MADRGFFIPDYLENIRASLIYQLYLNGREQLTKAEPFLRFRFFFG